MLRSVIIDDEPVLVRSLQTLIERSGCDIQVIGSANDGVTGLEMIRGLLPELAFVDISMPVVNGLQLIETLRQEGIDTAVVILSGYKEFEYAKRAVALDVVDYLVKPINPVEFKSFLIKISQKLQQDRHEKIRAQLNLAMSRPEAPLPGWMRSMAFDCWKICFDVFSYYRKMGVDAQAEDLRRALLGVLRSCCQGNDVWLSETRYPNEFNLILAAGDGKDSRIRSIYDACRAQLTNQTVTVALGGRAIPAAQLRSAARQANAVLQSGAVFASSRFLLQETASGPQRKEDISALCRLLRDGETDKAGRLLQQLLRKCQETACTQANLAAMLKQILQGCGKEDLQTDADYHVGILLEQSRSYEALLQNLEALLFQPGCQSGFTLNDKSSRAIIDTVAAHLAAHASEKISLQALAEEFGFNYTYLSYLFKKTLGRSPSEYVTQCRIDQAKRLLSQSEERSVKEISNAVGYDDPYFFSRVFKAATGLSPSEYRKLKQT